MDRKMFCVVTWVVLVGGMAPGLLSAAVVDLTGGEGASGTIEGALFEFLVEQPAGTGVIDPIVRLQHKRREQGYNTSGRPVPFDEKKDPNFTRDLTFGEIETVQRDGVEYLEFLLDINEANSRAKSLLSLDTLQIYTSSSGGQTTTDVGSLGTLRYDLDAGGDSHILLDHRAAEGSGKTDMAALIPLSLFDGVQETDFIYLYSVFGLTARSDGGFEEWAIRGDMGPPSPAPPIPTPATLPMGVTLLALAGLLRRCGLL